MVPSTLAFPSKTKYLNKLLFNPWSPNSDDNEISLYVIATCSNIQVVRIKEMITKDKMSWYLDKFSFFVPREMYGE